MELGHGRQPLLAEEVEEGRPVLSGLRFADVRAERAPRHPAAGPERLQQGGHGPDDPDAELRERSHRGEALGIHEDVAVPGGRV